MIAAIVPAAGESRRMGRPKLLLALDGITVIARVVRALNDGGADLVVVVTPPAFAPGSGRIRDEAARAGAVTIVPPEQPQDMRASFETGLRALETSGTKPKTVLLTPADFPGLASALVAEVIERAQAHPDAIVVPTVLGRRGHPLALPWRHAAEVRELPEGVGVNALVARLAHRIMEIPIDEPGAIADLDTPEDYRRWVGRDIERL